MRPPSGLIERSAFWLLLIFVVTLLVPRLFPHIAIGLSPINALSLVLLLVCAGILLYRWMLKHLLWKVRNRLIVTYLLMGLTPVVLFIILATISAYIFAGQFATFAATEQLNDMIARLSAENRALTVHIGHTLAVHHGPPGVVELPDSAEIASMSIDSAPIKVQAWDNGRPVKLTGGRSLKLTPAAVNADPLPDWPPSGFHGVVFLDRRLFLCAVDKLQFPGHAVALISTMPLDRVTLSALARGLGIMRILPAVNLKQTVKSRPGVHVISRGSKALDVDAGGEEITGGTLRAPIYFFDNRVSFGAPLPTTDWTTGQAALSLLSVTSRPTLLYGKLFGTALQVGETVRDALIAIAVLFAVLELIAFIMAVRLNRTITQSIADLYGATMAIDRGDFNHRIRVQRRDQLGVLSTSFNSMSESLQKLLEQQREKERMQSELAIAQEVQNNLFPQGEIKIPGLELHGICKPARTVSGDYYDFLLMGRSELCLALGDISGKGISAALLMASLHSAVRAYRFAGEDCEENANSGFTGIATFSSPGKVLSLLNRHLYRSTAPEKYATLFLAHYDADTRKLTYSNGGQLPPLVLCANGQTKRLDYGGTVVGLLAGMRYEEATISLDRGDLLVAYSDGVTEPENDFGEFGEDRLMEIVKRHRHQPLAVISSHTLQAVRDWIGEGEQPDDITLVLARKL